MSGAGFDGLSANGQCPHPDLLLDGEYRLRLQSWYAMLNMNDGNSQHDHQLIRPWQHSTFTSPTEPAKLYAKQNTLSLSCNTRIAGVPTTFLLSKKM